ncbi:endonuclease I family protein [Myroides sp. N17-2]|uniref:endonuclease I family protein n=1 Tax=Myroides sp. N17-2 TaxID=2030799 RepID=UPI000EFDAC89|nr:endonuclease [Myroides sp. N17-2]
MIKRLSIALCLSLLTLSCSKDDSVQIKDPETGTTKPPVITPPIGNDKDIPDPKTFRIPSEYSDYYQGIDWSKKGMELKKELANLVTRTHHPIPYTPGVWEASKITDEDPENENNVLLIYGWPDKDSKNSTVQQRSINKDLKYDSDANRHKRWEREHVFAKSLTKQNNSGQLALDANPNYNYIGRTIAEIAGTDVHNLRPINGQWNNDRSNRKFTDGKGNAGAIGPYWYPGDEWKGDVARMMLYMHIRYQENRDSQEYQKYKNYTIASKVGIALNPRAPLDDGMIDLFLKWNAEDPVSEIERKRNEYHGNTANKYAQGNRNPFIDNPSLANVIWRMPQYNAENKWK